jgi:ABC-type lipoprotein release transport system permease subunit
VWLNDLRLILYDLYNGGSMSSKNNDGKIVIALIISLIAFGLGSGIGIAVGISGDSFNSSDAHEPVNTTIDVTNNISQDNPNYNMDAYPFEENNLSSDSNSSNSGVYYSEEDLVKNNSHSITIG